MGSVCRARWTALTLRVWVGVWVCVCVWMRVGWVDAGPRARLPGGDTSACHVSGRLPRDSRLREALGGALKHPTCGLTSLVTNALAETDFSRISVSQLLPMGSSAYETDPRGLRLGATLGKERKTGEPRAPAHNAPSRPASTDLRQRPGPATSAPTERRGRGVRAS